MRAEYRGGDYHRVFSVCLYELIVLVHRDRAEYADREIRRPDEVAVIEPPAVLINKERDAQVCEHLQNTEGVELILENILEAVDRYRDRKYHREEQRYQRILIHCVERCHKAYAQVGFIVKHLALLENNKRYARQNGGSDDDIIEDIFAPVPDEVKNQNNKHSERKTYDKVGLERCCKEHKTCKDQPFFNADTLGMVGLDEGQKIVDRKNREGLHRDIRRVVIDVEVEQNLVAERAYERDQRNDDLKEHIAHPRVHPNYPLIPAGHQKLQQLFCGVNAEQQHTRLINGDRFTGKRQLIEKSEDHISQAVQIFARLEKVDVHKHIGHPAVVAEIVLLMEQIQKHRRIYDEEYHRQHHTLV